MIEASSNFWKNSSNIILCSRAFIRHGKRRAAVHVAVNWIGRWELPELECSDKIYFVSCLGTSWLSKGLYILLHFPCSSLYNVRNLWAGDFLIRGGTVYSRAMFRKVFEPPSNWQVAIKFWQEDVDGVFITFLAIFLVSKLLFGNTIIWKLLLRMAQSVREPICAEKKTWLLR